MIRNQFFVFSLFSLIISCGTIEKKKITNNSYNSFENKIVGGTAAAKGEFSFIAVIRNYGKNICGGTLIDEQWILTAAHCMYYTDFFGQFHQVDTEDFEIILGRNNIDNSTDGEVHKIAQVHIHEKYDPVAKQNDIALIKIDKKSKFIPIKLSKSKPKAGDILTVAGWGKTIGGLGGGSQGEESSIDLQKTELPIVSDETCEEHYIILAQHDVIDFDGLLVSQLCAGHAEGGKDSCQGDSGGPLFITNKDYTFTQAGIVSWGLGCAIKGLYGVYTNVGYYIKWIESTKTKTKKINVYENQSISSNEWLHFEPIKANSGTFIVSMSGPGDTDLYVKKNDRPTLIELDCRPYKDNSNETCDFKVLENFISAFMQRPAK